MALVVTFGFIIQNINKSNKVPYYEKIVLSERLLVTREPGSLENNISACDVAIKGDIIKIEPYSMEMYSGYPEFDAKLRAMGGPPVLQYTKYTVEVSETIIGDIGEAKTVTYLELGGLKDSVTKPQGKESVILFLNERPKGFVSVNGEHSIFVFSEKDGLYSYSNTKELSEYDGLSYQTLIEDINSLKDRYNK